MLNWFRSRTASLALVTLASFGATGALSLTPHADDCHDTACPAAAVQHDASAHRFEAAQDNARQHPLHCCFFCHSVRSFRPDARASFQASPADDKGLLTVVDLFFVTPAALAAQPPLRSPPVAV